METELETEWNFRQSTQHFSKNGHNSRNYRKQTTLKEYGPLAFNEVFLRVCLPFIPDAF